MKELVKWLEMEKDIRQQWKADRLMSDIIALVYFAMPVNGRKYTILE